MDNYVYKLPLNVLFLTNLPTPYRVDFFNTLSEHCHLTVLFERYSAQNRESSWLDRENTRFKAIYLHSIHTGIESGLSFGVFHWLRKKFDLVVVGGYSTPTGILAILLMRLMGKTFLLNSDGGFVKPESKGKRWLKRFLISSASGWLSPAQETDQYLCYYGAKRERTYRYPFTSLRRRDILTQVISDDAKHQAKKNLSIPGQTMVLAVGQFIPRKGFDVLIRAAALLPQDITVVIVGGQPNEEYRQLIQSLAVENVISRPFQNREDLKAYYKAADLFVHPTREDIWGLVINEAMAAGLPVVTTNRCIAGMELIKPGINGYIIQVDDVQGLIGSINKAFQSDLNKMGEESISIIRKHTIDDMVEAHITALNLKSEVQT